MAQTRIKLIKSLVGSHKNQIATAWSSGLYKTGDCTTQPDSPQTKGKAVEIIHLIEVSRV